MNDKDRLDNLETKIDLLSKKLNAIYEVLKDNNKYLKINNKTEFTNAIQPQTSNKIQVPKPKVSKKNSDTNKNLIYKNTIDFDGIIDNISDTKNRNSVIKLRDNKYPTVTKSQLEWIYNLIK